MSLLAGQTVLSPTWVSAHLERFSVTCPPNGGQMAGFSCPGENENLMLGKDCNALTSAIHFAQEVCFAV